MRSGAAAPNTAWAASWSPSGPRRLANSKKARGEMRRSTSFDAAALVASGRRSGGRAARALGFGVGSSSVTGKRSRKASGRSSGRPFIVAT